MWCFSYGNFGKVVGQSDATVEFLYGYTGRDKDGETGLDYYRARYYDSVNGRFISEDPLWFDRVADGHILVEFGWFLLSGINGFNSRTHRT